MTHRLWAIDIILEKMKRSHLLKSICGPVWQWFELVFTQLQIKNLQWFQKSLKFFEKGRTKVSKPNRNHNLLVGPHVLSIYLANVHHIEYDQNFHHQFQQISFGDWHYCRAGIRPPFEVAMFSTLEDPQQFACDLAWFVLASYILRLNIFNILKIL